MYLVSYQKRNGDIFCRIRNTIPQYGIGKETSMGWKIIDVKYRFKDNFYTLPECSRLQKKAYKRVCIFKKISKILKKYSTTIILLIIILLLISK